MNTKLITLAIALTLPLTVAAFPGGAGGNNSGNGNFQGQGGNKMERISQKLDLSAEQKPKVQAIFMQQREKFNAIKKETRSRLQEVLSAEQMQTFDAMKAKRKEKRQNGQGNRMNMKNKQNQMQNQ